MPRRPRPAHETPEQLWVRLSGAFEAFHCGNLPDQSFEQLYRAAYRLQILGKGPWALRQTREWHSEWLRQQLLVKLQPFVQKLQSLHSPLFGEVSSLQRQEALSWVSGVIDVCDGVFRHYFTAINTISEDLLAYVEKAQSTEGSSSTHASCLEAFSKTMMTETHVGQIAKTPMQLIGQAIMMDLDYGFAEFHDRLRSLVVTIEKSQPQADLDSTMHRMYLEQRRQMYKAAAPMLVERGSALDFFRFVRRQLLREELCANTMIPRSMEEAAKSLLLDEVLQPHLQKVMNGDTGSLTALLREEAYRETSLIYEIVSLIDKDVQSLKSLCRNWLQMQVELVRSENNSGVTDGSAFSESLSDLKQRASDIVRTAFHADPEFVMIVEETCDGYLVR